METLADGSSPAKTLDSSARNQAAVRVAHSPDPTELGLGLGLGLGLPSEFQYGVRVPVGVSPVGNVVVGAEQPKQLARVSVESEKVLDFNGGEVVAVRAEVVLDGNKKVEGEKGLVGNSKASEVGIRIEGNKVDDGGGKSLGDGDGTQERKEGKDQMEANNQEKQFSIGDFVWGKIKSHPWWPGQIYDPSDASEYAGRLYRPDQVLVSYFGDGTFAWCYPSQLKPMGANFERMSKQSTSRGFIKAVQKAIDEFGRCVESEMTCSCMEARSKLVKPFTVNAGIKEGATVPDGKIGEYCISGFNPAGFLVSLKNVARVASMRNTLELTVLKSRLSAFYHAKGYGDLPVCYDPHEINDLEENFDGKAEEEFHLRSGGVGRKRQSSALKRPDISEDKSYQKKKQRSMAELMAGNEDVDGENGSSADAGELPSTASKRQRKIRNASSQREKGVGKLVSNSGKLKEANHLASPSAVLGEEKISNGENEMGGAEKGMVVSSVRMRKKSKYLSPPYTMLSHKGFSSLEYPEEENVTTPKTVKASEGDSTKRIPGQRSEVSHSLLKCSGESFEKKASKGARAEVNTPGSASLAPPKQEEKLDIEIYNIDAGKLLSFLSSAAVNLSLLKKGASYKPIKAFFLRFRSSMYRRGSGYDTHTKSHAGLEDKKRKFSLEGESVGTNRAENKSGHLGSVAKTKQSTLERRGSLKKDSGAVVRTTRSSGQKGFGGRKRISLADNHGSSGNEDGLKVDQSEGQSEQKKRKQKDEQSSKTPKKSQQVSVEKLTSSERAGGLDIDMNHKVEANVEGPASLLLTFAPGCTFPSIEDLVTIFDKFGELNRSETEILKDSACARVVFARSSDAEKALTNLEKITALSPTVVSYGLRYLSPSSTEGELTQFTAQKVGTLKARMASKLPVTRAGGRKSKSPVSAPVIAGASGVTNIIPELLPTHVPGAGGGINKIAASSTPVVAGAPLQFIKNNLEKMVSTLIDSTEKGASSAEKLAPEVRANLASEINGLLKKVNGLVDSSS